MMRGRLPNVRELSEILLPKVKDSVFASAYSDYEKTLLPRVQRDAEEVDSWTISNRFV